MLAFDIKNAFNSIHRNSILTILDSYNEPNKLKDIIADYLRNRKIIISESEIMDYNIGVPQESSLGPILWLLGANELLKKSKEESYKLIMYDDDIVVLVSSTAYFHLTELSRKPINDIISWCDSHHLTLSLEKCCFTIFKRGKNIKHIPRIKIQNYNIKYTNS